MEEVLGELTSDTLVSLVSQMPKDDEGFLKESVGAGAGRGFGIKGGGLRLVLPSQVMLSRPRAAKLIFYQPVKYFHKILDL